MYIHRGILLLFLMLFVFSPTAQEWMSNNNAQWYRPYIGWAVVILLAYTSQRRQNRNNSDV